MVTVVRPVFSIQFWISSGQKELLKYYERESYICPYILDSSQRNNQILSSDHMDQWRSHALIHMCIYIECVKKHPYIVCGRGLQWREKCVNSFKPPGLLDPPFPPSASFFFFSFKRASEDHIVFHKLLTSVLISVPLTWELC